MSGINRHPTHAASRGVSRPSRANDRRSRLVRSAVESLEDRRMFAAGDLDGTFSGDGVAQLADTLAGRFGGGAVALPGGKTFVVGSTEGGAGFYGRRAYLARYNADGSLDTTFSGDGRATFHWGIADDDAVAGHVLVRPDGKIVVGGASGDGSRDGTFILGIALLNADGSFDTGFGGGDGRLLLDVPDSPSDGMHSLSLAPGNKLVAALSTGLTSSFRVMRLNANGTPDTTFGGTGFVNLNPGAFDEHAASAAVTADGGVVVGGMRYLAANQPTEQYETTLVKLRSNGTVDTAFGGGDGQVDGTFASDAFLELRAAPGGKVVAAGHTGVARFNADGSPDSTFSGDGKASRGASAGPLRDLAVGSDGKVYVVGQSLRHAELRDSSFVVARFTNTGGLDSTWDGDGTATTNFFAGRDDPSGIALHSDGKVSVAGTADPVETNRSLQTIVVAKYTSGGRPDTAFSGDGRTNNDFSSVLRVGGALALQPDGKSVVGGAETRASSSAPTGLGQDFFLARYTAGGSLDTSFSGDGRLTTDFAGGTDRVTDVLVQPDGKILALGWTRTADGEFDIALARYTAGGSLDTTFSGDGRATIDLASGDQGAKLALRSDGDIILSASSTGDPGGNFVLVRLNPNGSMDTTLGGTGVLRHNLGTAFTLQPDNKILIAALGVGGLYVTRLNTNGTTDTTYADGGRTQGNDFGDTDATGLRARDISLQGGKPLVLAEASFEHGAVIDVALFRFDAGGSIDESFGFGEHEGQGRTVYQSPDTNRELPQRFAIDPAGRILVGATLPGFEPNADLPLSNWGLYRINGADGTPDEDFGPGGRRVMTTFAGELGGLAVGADNRPILGGTYFTPDSVYGTRNGGLALVRFEAGQAPAAEQTPFLGSPFFVDESGPVRIQAEDFDRGGEGVAYHDLTPTNTGGAYRANEGVDVKPTTDSGGGHRLSDAMAGEWLEYALDVGDDGAYDFGVRVGSPAAGGALHVEIDGVDVTGRLAVPNTGGYDNMVTLTKTGVQLTAGRHVLRLVMDANSSTGATAGVNWLHVSSSVFVEPPPPSGDPVTLRAAADAYVRDGASSGTNFGVAAELVSKTASTAGSNRETYLRFDLSTAPATIASAKLRLNGRLGDTTSPSLQTRVYGASDTTWTEAGLTWDNRPPTGASPLGTITVSGTTAAWYELDLTAFLQAEKSAGRNLVTLVLRNPTASTAQSVFASDEATSGRPELMVS